MLLAIPKSEEQLLQVNVVPVTINTLVVPQSHVPVAGFQMSEVLEHLHEELLALVVLVKVPAVPQILQVPLVRMIELAVTQLQMSLVESHEKPFKQAHPIPFVRPAEFLSKGQVKHAPEAVIIAVVPTSQLQLPPVAEATKEKPLRQLQPPFITIPSKLESMLERHWKQFPFPST